MKAAPIWVVGDRVESSSAPALFNAALRSLMLPVEAIARSCGASDVENVLLAAEKACLGIHVPAPHAVRAAARYLEVSDERARAAGAADTVVYDKGRAVRALNSCVAGLLVAWRRAAVPVRGRTAAIVGAGAAARAAIVALAEAGASGVVLHARRVEAATGLLATAAAAQLEATVARATAPPASLVVLCASELEQPEEWIKGALQGPGIVHDLRDHARAREAQRAALQMGALFIDGSTLALAQARAALEALVANPLPDDANRAMERALVALRRTT